MSHRAVSHVFVLLKDQVWQLMSKGVESAKTSRHATRADVRKLRRDGAMLPDGSMIERMNSISSVAYGI